LAVVNVGGTAGGKNFASGLVRMNGEVNCLPGGRFGGELERRNESGDI